MQSRLVNDIQACQRIVNTKPHASLSSLLWLQGLIIAADIKLTLFTICIAFSYLNGFILLNSIKICIIDLAVSMIVVLSLVSNTVMNLDYFFYIEFYQV